MKIDPGFQVFYGTEFSKVFRAALLLSGNRQVAEDATQEAFARALARWRRLSGEPWAAGWVVTTALNVVRRASRKPPGSSLVALSQDPPDTAGSIDLRAAVAALPPRQQEAIALHYLMDMSVTETASAMGVDDGTIKAHLARARASLALALAADEQDAPIDRTTNDPPDERESYDALRSEDA